MANRRSAAPAPTPNADGGYLPMPFTNARRIEREREEYRERRRLHGERFPGYAAGFRHPSPRTAAAVCELVGVLRFLSAVEQQALTVMLDAAIQAGEDGRLLTTNLMFDVVAAGLSDHYRAAVERGPARVSYEMQRATLKAAWRDLLRNEIDFGKLLLLARRGCGLYEVNRGRDGRDTVVLRPKRPVTRAAELERRRAAFVAIVADDAATGGTYQRRSSAGRLLVVGEQAADPLVVSDTLEHDDATEDEDWSTHKIVAEWVYNVATPAPRSSAVIDTLESVRLYLDPKAVIDEYERLDAEAAEINAQLWDEVGFDVDKCPSATRMTRRGQRVRLRGVYIARFAKSRSVAWQPLTDLVKQYNRWAGWARQLKPVAEQLKAMGAVDGELKIRSRFAKLANRRYQSRDFWLTEVSGRQQLTQTVTFKFPDSNVLESSTTTNQRGRFFRIAAFDPDPRFEPRQYLFGVDVSSSQIQILAILCGDHALEERLRRQSFHRELAAPRAWARHLDFDDEFKLPAGFGGADDPRLVESLKTATMTSLYGSDPHAIAEELTEDVDDKFGPGLGDSHNIRLFLNDDELGLARIEHDFKAVCREIAERACATDAYAGVTFTDPFDGAAVRWNPVKWALKKVAGAGDVRIWAKVPSGKPNAAGKYPVWRAKLRRMVMPCLIHMLDAMFASLVIEELSRHGVPVVSVHDAWYVAADATQYLDAARNAAGESWLKRLDVVYADLERLLGDSPRAAWIQALRRQWAKRVENEDWPQFKVGEVATIRE